MKNGIKEIEISTHEINCFFSAIVSIMKHDEKWGALSVERKNETIVRATSDFITNYYEEVNGLQSCADVIFFLLKDIGYGENTEARWREVLSHPPMEDAINHFNLQNIQNFQIS